MVSAVDSYKAWLENLDGYQHSLLRLLGDRRYHTQSEMWEATSHRFSAVVKRLRGKGFVIESKCKGGTEWVYKLISCPKLD